MLYSLTVRSKSAVERRKMEIRDVAVMRCLIFNQNPANVVFSSLYRVMMLCEQAIHEFVQITPLIYDDL